MESKTNPQELDMTHPEAEQAAEPKTCLGCGIEVQPGEAPPCGH